jgi:hypothetical protein
MQYASCSSKLQIAISAIIAISLLIGIQHYINDNPRYLFFVGEIAFFILAFAVTVRYKRSMSFDCATFRLAPDILYTCKLNLLRLQMIIPFILVASIYQYVMNNAALLLGVLCVLLMMIINRFCKLAIVTNTPVRVLVVAAMDIPVKLIHVLTEPMDYLRKHHYTKPD